MRPCVRLRAFSIPPKVFAQHRRAGPVANRPTLRASLFLHPLDRRIFHIASLRSAIGDGRTTRPKRAPNGGRIRLGLGSACKTCGLQLAASRAITSVSTGNAFWGHPFENKKLKVFRVNPLGVSFKNGRRPRIGVFVKVSHERQF